MKNWLRMIVGGSMVRAPGQRFRPRLEALDERAVPDGNPGEPPGGGTEQPPSVIQDTLSVGEWLWIDGEGSDASWLTIGADGAVWFVVGSTNDPTFAFIGDAPFGANGPELQLNVAPPTMPPPDPPPMMPPPAPLPPSVAPPPRPDSGVVQAGIIIQGVGWYIQLAQDGTIRISNTNSGNSLEFRPNGTVWAISPNGVQVQVPPPPRP